jgi:hypothetical protein
VDRHVPRVGGLEDRVVAARRERIQRSHQAQSRAERLDRRVVHAGEHERVGVGHEMGGAQPGERLRRRMRRRQQLGAARRARVAPGPTLRAVDGDPRSRRQVSLHPGRRQLARVGAREQTVELEARHQRLRREQGDTQRDTDGGATRCEPLHEGHQRGRLEQRQRGNDRGHEAREHLRAEAHDEEVHGDEERRQHEQWASADERPRERRRRDQRGEESAAVADRERRVVREPAVEARRHGERRQGLDHGACGRRGRGGRRLCAQPREEQRQAAGELRARVGVEPQVRRRRQEHRRHGETGERRGSGGERAHSATRATRAASEQRRHRERSQ